MANSSIYQAFERNKQHTKSAIDLAVDTATTWLQGQINKKANDFSIEIYNGTGGNPKPVKFASFNYSTCGSENGIAAKISLVSGHGNGSSYAFLEDAIIRVNYQGGVEVDNFKYYGAATDTYDGAKRQYGDIFWTIDTTNKFVDFYVLMGQYARVYQTPWKRLTYSTGGTVTQWTTCTVYSSGDKNWANNSEYALMSDIPTPSTETWTFTLEDGSSVTKEVYTDEDGGNSSTSKGVVCKINNGISVIDTGLTYSRGVVEVRRIGGVLWINDSGVYNFTDSFTQANNRTVLQFTLPKAISNKIHNVNGVYGGTGTIGYSPALAYENVTYTTFNCQSYLKRSAIGDEYDTFQLVYTGLNAINGGGLCGFHLKMPIFLVDAEE